MKPLKWEWRSVTEDYQNGHHRDDWLEAREGGMTYWIGHDGDRLAIKCSANEYEELYFCWQDLREAMKHVDTLRSLSSAEMRRREMACRRERYGDDD